MKMWKNQFPSTSGNSLMINELTLRTFDSKANAYSTPYANELRIYSKPSF